MSVSNGRRGQSRRPDLVEREGLFYEKFTVVPFSGKIDEELERGSFKDGKREGLWFLFYENGQLNFTGTYKDGVKVE